MKSINSQQIFNISQAEDGKFIKLDTTNIPELSTFPQGAYALLTTSVSELDGSSGNVYQDAPFTTQVFASVSSSLQVAPYDKSGWVTISIDSATSDTVFVGTSSVSVSTGYKLSNSMPSITVSSSELSQWYVIGANGGEIVYICGAYINV